MNSKNSDISAVQTRPPRIRRGDKFLSGQIPWDWICACARIPGKALHVGAALWLWKGIKKGYTVKLRVKGLEEMGVSRHAAYRALKRMEEAGLVSVERHPGRSPVVTLLDVHPVGKTAKASTWTTRRLQPLSRVQQSSKRRIPE